MNDMKGLKDMKGNGGVAPLVVSSDATQAEWDAYVVGHADATVDHLWAWRHIFEQVFGHRCLYLVARRDAAVVGVLPLVLFRSRLFGRSIVSVPFLNYGGLLADDAEATLALTERARQTAREFRAAHVELRHSRRQLEDVP